MGVGRVETEKSEHADQEKTTSKQEKRCINTRAASRLQKPTAAKGPSPFALRLPYLHRAAYSRVDYNAHRQADSRATIDSH
jgi:hypothetical protein